MTERINQGNLLEQVIGKSYEVPDEEVSYECISKEKIEEFLKMDSLKQKEKNHFIALILSVIAIDVFFTISLILFCYIFYGQNKMSFFKELVKQLVEKKKYGAILFVCSSLSFFSSFILLIIFSKTYSDAVDKRKFVGILEEMNKVSTKEEFKGKKEYAKLVILHNRFSRITKIERLAYDLFEALEDLNSSQL